MTTTEEGIRVAVSLSQKVNLGNYESADVFCSLSNVPIDATQQEIDDALDTGKIVYDAIRLRLRDKVKQIRGGLA